MDSATLWTKEIYAGFQSKLTPILSRADPGEPNPLLFRPSLSTSLSPSPSRLHRPSPLSSSSFSPSLFLSTFPSPLLHSPRRQHGGALPSAKSGGTGGASPAAACSPPTDLAGGETATRRRTRAGDGARLRDGGGPHRIWRCGVGWR